MFCLNRALVFVSLFLLFSPYSLGALSSKNRCQICKDFVASFEKGLETTANSNYAGGDTSWEEEKLGSYANSEVRLVEILDNVCQRSSHECHNLLEMNEEHIERWWFKLRRNGRDDLKAWLCFDHLDVCCPENTFGPKCEACPGGVENPCGGHGKCKGSEEKDEVGECSCDSGYEGDMCQTCSKGYYNDSDICLACDKACLRSCEGPGPDECDDCASGYQENEEGTCLDKNECEEEGEGEGEGEGGEDKPLCKEGTYCHNTPGSYRCNACDKSCAKGCTGAGPAKCVECASGYEKREAGITVCRDIDECKADDSLCQEGTYCENTQGSYTCKACHISCKLTCTGPGADKCTECKDGYSMENDSCTDVNECDQLDPAPCDNETETCQNLIGTHVCKCKTGLVRVDSKCVPEDEAPKSTKSASQTPGAKKKKKKVKKPKKKSSESTEGKEEGPRRYPWYYTTGPLALFFVTYKYTKPNLVTSAGLVLVLALVAVISP